MPEIPVSGILGSPSRRLSLLTRSYEGVPNDPTMWLEPTVQQGTMASLVQNHLAGQKERGYSTKTREDSTAAFSELSYVWCH